MFSIGRYALAFALACSLCACGGGYDACRKDPITGAQQCQRTSGDYGQAAATAGVAAGSWAAVGCTVNGCTPPYHCNQGTKMCERIRCAESTSACPPGFACDPEQLVCK